MYAVYAVKEAASNRDTTKLAKQLETVAVSKTGLLKILTAFPQVFQKMFVKSSHSARINQFVIPSLRIANQETFDFLKNNKVLIKKSLGKVNENERGAVVELLASLIELAGTNDEQLVALKVGFGISTDLRGLSKDP